MLRIRRRSHRPLAIVGALLLSAGSVLGCGSDGSRDVGAGRDRVGFVFVGTRDDLGYNQAAWEASESLARSLPDIEVVRVENVPETDEAVTVMQELIDDGAGLVFATSFGHLDAAVTIARANPDVVVVHQGGRETEADLSNFGTFWGTHHEIMWAAGIAAAADTETGVVGFVGAFDIPATYANANALLLGARSVDTTIEVVMVLTGDWCDPDAQADAYDRVRAAGADVLAMHQDCTAPLLTAAEADGIGAVGYHADGSEVAPRSWLTAAVWNWEGVYRDITEHWLVDEFAGSVYDDGFRGTLGDGTNPASLAEPGTRVPPEVVEAMTTALDDFARGRHDAFEGPLVDVDGEERVPVGRSLGVVEADTMDWLVEGVRVLD